MNLIKTSIAISLSVFLVLGLLSLVSAPAMGKNEKLVFIANGPDRAIPMLDINGPVRQPVQHGCTITLPDGVAVSTGLPDACLNPVVPAGKRLVIQFVNATANLPSPQVPGLIIQTATQQFGQPPGTTIQCNHQISFGVPAPVGTLNLYTATHETTMYADQTDDVTIIFDRTGTSGSATFQVNWAGYLVDTP